MTSRPPASRPMASAPMASAPNAAAPTATASTLAPETASVRRVAAETALDRRVILRAIGGLHLFAPAPRPISSFRRPRLMRALRGIRMVRYHPRQVAEILMQLLERKPEREDLLHRFDRQVARQPEAADLGNFRQVRFERGFERTLRGRSASGPQRGAVLPQIIRRRLGDPPD